MRNLLKTTIILNFIKYLQFITRVSVFLIKRIKYRLHLISALSF